MTLLFGIQHSKQNCCGFEGGDREGAWEGERTEERAMPVPLSFILPVLYTAILHYSREGWGGG